MHGAALLVALSVLGVDTAWRQTDDGQVEYVLQIEPVLLSALAEGKEIASELPEGVERLDRLCIRIGSGTLRTLAKTAPDWPELNQSAEQRAASAPPPDAPLAVYAKPSGDLYGSHDLTHGWQPASENESTYLIQLDPAFLKLLEEGDEVYAAILPEAGIVRQFRITAGTDTLPRKAGRPPVVPVTQLQAQAPRTSSPAADVPPVSDLTGGANSSVYDGPEVTDLGEAAAPAKRGAAGLDSGRQSSAGMLQPPVPQFDRGQFGKSKPSSTGVSRSTTRSPASTAPPPRYSAQQPEEAEFAEQEPPPRMASRTTGAGSLAQEQLHERRANLPSASTPDEKKPEFPAMAFTLSLFALFLSIGANLYLGWTAAEFYSRYKLAVERLRSAGRN